MALPRFHKLPAERRHRLIAAAAEELAEKGYEGAALVAIAERSGIGKASVYYYFADKADLCRTVLEEAWQILRLEGRVDLGALTAETFWSSVQAAAHENLARCDREPWLLSASKVLNRAAADPSVNGVLGEFAAKRRAWETSYVRRGQELGTVRADLPAELLVTVSLAVRQTANLWILEHLGESAAGTGEDLAGHVFEIYRAVLSPPPAWGGPVGPEALRAEVRGDADQVRPMR
ncbi:MAG: TetR/AcrR family transcriptional regulator [Thermoanaerobaculia bacterium]